MKPLISPAAMRDMEQRYFDKTGTPSIQLMERAARALAQAILRRCDRNSRIWFACGPGGNGGDGYACARRLQAAGMRCAVFPAEAPRSPDAVENYKSAREAGIQELTIDKVREAPDIWVDALYGTGLSRAPEGGAAALIGRMNADRARGSLVVAVDIPSGLDGGTGAAWDPCVHADVTYSFQFAKTGCFLADGLDACGRVEALDIGIPRAYWPGDLAGLMGREDVRRALPARPRNAHKGGNGHLLIVAGCMGMAGGAAMCALSALRSGAGLVTVACPQSIAPIIQTLAPCAMCLPLPERNGAIAPEAARLLQAALKGKDAVACGCGLSRRAAPEALRVLLGCGLPALFDADALNLIAADGALRAMLRPNHVITPHPGEAARLLKRNVSDPVADAQALKALGCQALLKGAATVIPLEGRAVLSTSGAAGMAKGGSGDCLTGLLGGLMAERAAAGLEVSGAALGELSAVASEIHGKAGELAQAKRGVRGMCAMDIVEALPEAFRYYE